MLAIRVIPCLDVDEGRVVKGIRFQNLRDAGDPVALAAQYEAQGADELVLLDISATPQGRKHHLKTVESVRQVLSIPFTVGGGVGSRRDAENLLTAGADKVSVNTAAVRDRHLIREIATHLGSQCMILAVDAKREGEQRWQVLIQSGKKETGLDVIEWVKEAEGLGVGEILLTSFDRDGTRLGYDVDLIAAVARAVRVPIIASGGAESALHMKAAIERGASAVLAASIFHDGMTTVEGIKRELMGQGVPVRC